MGKTLDSEWIPHLKVSGSQLPLMYHSIMVGLKLEGETSCSRFLDLQILESRGLWVFETPLGNWRYARLCMNASKYAYYYEIRSGLGVEWGRG